MLTLAVEDGQDLVLLLQGLRGGARGRGAGYHLLLLGRPRGLLPPALLAACLLVLRVATGPARVVRLQHTERSSAMHGAGHVIEEPQVTSTPSSSMKAWSSAFGCSAAPSLSLSSRPSSSSTSAPSAAGAGLDGPGSPAGGVRCVVNLAAGGCFPAGARKLGVRTGSTPILHLVSCLCRTECFHSAPALLALVQSGSTCETSTRVPCQFAPCTSVIHFLLQSKAVKFYILSERSSNASKDIIFKHAKILCNVAQLTLVVVGHPAKIQGTQ